MKKNTYNITINALLLVPVILFILLYALVGLPEESIFTKNIFYLQTAVTMVIIITIPLLLWLIRRDKFKATTDLTDNNENKWNRYQLACYLRLTYFMALAILCICLYIFLPNVSFFYLAVITYLSMFFARG